MIILLICIVRKIIIVISDKSDMGDRLRIATENGATYEIFSNTPIPESVKQWLTKKGITFTELLD